jgi:hypoxanthine phosphoribosyltransferase
MELYEIVKPQEVAEAVSRLAKSINIDYKGKNPVVVGVLKGCFMFISDLVRQVEVPVEVDFIRARSYGGRKVSSGEVSIIHDIEIDVSGRNVIIVEDIVDTGLTLKAIIAHIEKKGPVSVKVCTLLDKPSGRKALPRLDYVGIKVSEAFLVGYGLDLAEKHRNLGGIYEIR